MMQQLKDFFTRHHAGLIGAFIGLFIGILILLIGFWRTLFLAFCTVIGLVIGLLYQSDTMLGDMLRGAVSFLRRGDE